MSTDPQQTTSPEKVTEPVPRPMAVGESQWILEAIRRLHERLDGMEARLHERINAVDTKIEEVRKLAFQVRGGIILLSVLITLVVLAFKVFNIQISVGGG